MESEGHPEERSSSVQYIDWQQIVLDAIGSPTNSPKAGASEEPRFEASPLNALERTATGSQNRNMLDKSDGYIEVSQPRFRDKERVGTPEPQRERPPWGVLDFIAAYFSNNTPSEVRLSDIGLAQGFENSASVRQAVEQYVGRVLDEAARPGSAETILLRETTITDVTRESSSLFSIGHSTLYMEGLCTSDQCYFNFSIKDRFTDPLLFNGGSFGVGGDFGRSYGITHSFHLPPPYVNPLPRGTPSGE